jgi:1,4-dihydroxy-2-naphthoyl-CoA hydrolase
MTTQPLNPQTWLTHSRTVRFGDTDAAGVMHFLQLLRWCHEAYEESLERFGLAAEAVFPRPAWAGESPAVALPIVYCQAEFRRPLMVGDQLNITLRPEALGPDGFEVSYSFDREGQPAAQGLTRHLAIAASERHRCPLPEGIRRWLEASGLGAGIRPL